MAGKIDVLENRVMHVELDLNAQGAKVEAIKSDYLSGHQAVLLAIATLPTKEDFKQYTKDMQDCVGVERKRIDDLYKRDTIGSLIVAALASFGIVLGATK
jgi:hypothetical protein